MKSISVFRLNAILLLFILSTAILYFGKAFLIPLFFGILFAMLLHPLCEKLEKWGLGRIASTFVGLLVIVLFIALLVGIIVAQGTSMADDLPQMQQRSEEMLNNLQNWIEGQYGVSPKEQITYLKKTLSKVAESGSSFFGGILSWIMGLLTNLVLVLLYFFFIMWKREKYKEFLLRLVDKENRVQIAGELTAISHVAVQYLKGRLVSIAFLAVVYITGFSIVGLPNAVLIALVAVLPTIVPYVGAFVGGFFPIVMVLIGGSSEMLLPIILILVIAQVIDNNIIEPIAEGESLDISPIFTIIAIVLGEMLWGVAGMILFIPLFAILKIVCDHIPSLHPYSFLLDNDITEPKWVDTVRKWFKK